MENIKVLIVGVSKYSIVENKNLPFCKNDIITIYNVVRERFGISKNDIITLGMEYIVTTDEFINTIKKLDNIIEEEDTFKFYFSGHGYKNKNNNHSLVFNDNIMQTQEIIEFFEKFNCKNKIIFMDCCFADKFNVNQKQKINIENLLSEFDGKGCAVLASSSEYQESYSAPGNKMSLFTNFLSDAIMNKFITREGKLSLRAISKYISLRIDMWNRNQREYV